MPTSKVKNVMTEKQIRKDINKKIKQLYQLREKKQRFIPGESRVLCSGRVYDEDEIIHLVDASLDFWLTAGRYARKLELELAQFVGVRSCLLTNSGSSANLLALSSLTSPSLKERRLQKDDEVITVASGFPTTVNPIIQNNLVPVFVDVDLGSYNVKVSQVKEAITKKTKAIFIAHTLGNPFAVDQILSIAREHHLWLIEDCCDALGAKFNGQAVGSFGDIATCSFYPAHQITMGEGGAVFTNDPKLKKILLSFRDWGRDCWCEPGKENTCGKRFDWQLGDMPLGYDHKYIYSHIGYNLKITDMQAAIGVAQLAKLPKFIQLRRKNFDQLHQFLKDYEPFLLLPESLDQAEPSWFGYPIYVKPDAPFSRRDIVGFLENHHIATRMLFAGNLTKQPAYQEVVFRKVGNLENADAIMKNLFWIGVYPGITVKQLLYIKSIFNKFFRSLKTSN